MKMKYIDVNGEYSCIRILPNGNTELVLEIPRKDKKSLLDGVDAIMAAGLPPLWITASPIKKKRSLNANDYLWVLCGKLAEKMQNGGVSVTKEGIYRHHIRRVGKYTTLAVKENAVKSFMEAWERNGVGWFCNVADTHKDGWKKVFVYFGSSTYSTKEMSILIDSVIQECQNQGIETMPKEELDSLLREWGK
jgi:hypothetical protein